ncbi:MAG: AAA family ATPase [Lachnospiraceae bacterium]|jgi:type II secretory pathway predicted ATPase ExeA
MMELTTRYGMEANPFLKNSKEILYASREYKEGMFRLDYLANTKGFGLLTGLSGCGKTTLVRNWSHALNTSLFKTFYTSFTTTTANEFYRNLALALGAMPAYRKCDNFRAIREEVNSLALDKRKTPVIIIDEANYVNTKVLNDLKLLFNFEMDSRDRAIVLLVGLPLLNDTLSLSIHEPLRQRIVMNYNIEGLSKEEGREYIAAKLKGVGCTQLVFEESAVEAILNEASGSAREINKLCNASLVIGNSEGADRITPEIVMQASNDITLG